MKDVTSWEEKMGHQAAWDSIYVRGFADAVRTANKVPVVPPPDSHSSAKRLYVFIRDEQAAMDSMLTGINTRSNSAFNTAADQRDRAAREVAALLPSVCPGTTSMSSKGN